MERERNVEHLEEFNGYYDELTKIGETVIDYTDGKYTDGKYTDINSKLDSSLKKLSLLEIKLSLRMKDLFSKERELLMSQIRLLKDGIDNLQWVYRN